MTGARRVIFGNQKRIQKATRHQSEFFSGEKRKFTLSAQDYFKKAYAGTESSDYADPIIPDVTADSLIDRVRWANKLRQLFTVLPMPSKTWILPRLTAGVNVYRQKEGESVKTASGLDQASSGYVSPTIDSVTMIANKFAAITGWTTELAEDAIISVPQLMFNELADSVGEYEELAMIQGDYQDGNSLTGTVGSGYAAPSSGYGAGDVRYSFDGLLTLTPAAASKTPYGTPDDVSPDNAIAGGSDKLTKEELDQLLALIEDQGYNTTDMFMRAKVAGRLRNTTEYEEFQRLDAIGTRAALIKGYVGTFYTADIFISNKIPVGTAFGTGANDSCVLAFDRSQFLIGDRRRVSFVRKHGFEEDVDEIRVTERIGFTHKHNEALAVIWNVDDSA
jgi:hypothetical protein